MKRFRDEKMKKEDRKLLENPSLAGLAEAIIRIKRDIYWLKIIVVSIVIPLELIIITAILNR